MMCNYCEKLINDKRHHGKMWLVANIVHKFQVDRTSAMCAKWGTENASSTLCSECVCVCFRMTYGCRLAIYVVIMRAFGGECRICGIQIDGHKFFLFAVMTPLEVAWSENDIGFWLTGLILSAWVCAWANIPAHTYAQLIKMQSFAEWQS